MSEPQLDKPGLLFLGTGVSSGLPQLCHVLHFTPEEVESYSRQETPVDLSYLDEVPAGSPAAKHASGCKTCLDAYKYKNGPNFRGNISVVFRVTPAQSSTSVDDADVQCSGDGPDKKKVRPMVKHRHLLIDMGKTFRQSALTHLIPNGISAIDAVFLTHDHMDAAGGLDDIRDLQHFTRPLGPNGMRQYMPDNPIQLYCSAKTLGAIELRYDYLYAASKLKGPSDRKVARLEFHVVNDEPSLPFDSFDFHGSAVTVLPVLHGGDYKCLGLAFGEVDNKTIFISDVTKIPDSVEAFVDECKLDVLVLDAICPAKPHFSHFTLREGLHYVKKWQPKKAFFVGMGCSIEHFEGQAVLDLWLATERKADPGFKVQSVQLATDGLFVPFG